MVAPPLDSRLVALTAGPRRFLVQWRLPLFIAALALFGSGSWYAAKQLGVSFAQLQKGPLLVMLALAPLSLLYAGVGMVLLARSARVVMPIGRATSLASWATLAEALPLPGGAMVRAGALMASGTGLARSSALVLANALLWIALAALGCGLAVWQHGVGVAGLLTFAGAGGTVLASGWLLRQGGMAVMVQSVLHRLSGMALIAIRLHLAFLTLGVFVSVADTLPFALANIAGSAAAIAPAGLGISETLAAAAAGTVNVPPAAAFLAVGLDRLICLTASGLLVFAASRWRSAEG
ncbi:MAG: hypothetical protein J0M19_08230 [Sphingomonadales bacterium]|nr:hypothetical protein [Sphingomonadales bacterium]